MDYVPFPNFSIDHYKIWFAQMEATFSLNGTISDTDKYNYLLTHIPMKYNSFMEDIILSPPREDGEDDQYEYFKHEFIKRMSVYQMQQEELGNKKPSEYFNKLRKMADKRVPVEFILNVWLNKLPLKVREIVCLEKTGDSDTLCEMADKVMALIRPETRVEYEDLSEDRFRTITRKVDELAKQVRITQMMLDADVFEALQDQPSVPGASNHQAKNHPSKIVFVYDAKQNAS